MDHRLQTLRLSPDPPYHNWAPLTLAIPPGRHTSSCPPLNRRIKLYLKERMRLTTYLSLFPCSACPPWLIGSAVNQAGRSPEGSCSSKAPSKHSISEHFAITLIGMAAWNAIDCLNETRRGWGCFLCVILASIMSAVAARTKAERREASWVIFNPASLFFFGIITFLLHSRTCLSSWHGNIFQLHYFIVSFIYFQMPFHTLLALTRCYAACGECAADRIVTETTTFLGKNKWIL